MSGVQISKIALANTTVIRANVWRQNVPKDKPTAKESVSTQTMIGPIVVDVIPFANLERCVAMALAP